MLSGAACCSLVDGCKGALLTCTRVHHGPCLAWRADPCLACSSLALALVPSSCPWLSSSFPPVHGVAGMVLAVILVSFHPAWLL